MVTQGARLKVRGKLTGRFADIFSSMYLLSATLRRFHADGAPEADVPVMRYASEQALSDIQRSFEGILENLDIPGLGWLLRGPVRAWQRWASLGRPPADRLGHHTAAALGVPGEQRDRLTDGLYVDANSHLATLERAFVLSCEVAPILSSLKRGGYSTHRRSLDQAVADGVLTAQDLALIQEAEALRDEALRVDDFSLEELAGAPPVRVTLTAAT